MHAAVAELCILQEYFSPSLDRSSARQTGAHSLTHGVEPFLRSSQFCSYSKTSQHFMEPKGSLPCSQEPSIGPYPEPDQSNPYQPMLLSLRSNFILSNHLHLGLPSGLFPSGFHINILYAFLFSPFTLYALPISFSLTRKF
jgi:hypothetical protein